MSKSREAFEVWFKTTKAYLMLEEANYFKEDLFKFIEPRCAYLHAFVDISFMTWQERQKKIDVLQKQVDAVRKIINDKKEVLSEFENPNAWDECTELQYSIAELEEALQGDTNA